MATILQRLKDQLKNNNVDVSNVQTITQALRKLNDIEVSPNMEAKTVTGNTISECLDDVEVLPVMSSTNSDDTFDPLMS